MTDLTLTVSQLNRHIQKLLEFEFPSVQVQGEISNFACPASGHWYFSLKDQDAQVRAAMFRNRNYLCRFRPENGQLVTARARVTLYVPRGEYQLVVEHLEPAGEGQLRLAFEQLREKLAREGLFDEDHKQPLPSIPETIGVITSPTGAAIRDILHVLERRFPAARVIIYPCQVQGRESAASICHALQQAQQRQEADVLILARGGGSLEDLWSFNDETLARALYHCPIPLVSGVGHETDVTIADWVADLRAPTPSAAAEAVSPDRFTLLGQLQYYQDTLGKLMQEQLGQHRQKLHHLARLLVRPDARLKEFTQRCDELELRLTNRINQQLSHASHALQTRQQRLQTFSPARTIHMNQQQLAGLYHRLVQQTRHQLNHHQQQLVLAAEKLQAISPLNTVARGYSITRDTQQHPVRSIKQVKPGDRLATQVADGVIESEVLGCQPTTVSGSG